MIKNLNLQSIRNPEAFLGKITTKVREEASREALEYGGKILDVGCGNCLLFFELISKYKYNQKSLFGIDINYELLKEAKNISKSNLLPLPNLINGDGTSLPFKDETFDTILCLTTFMNLNIDVVQKLIQEFSRVAKKNGTIIFDIRNKNNILLKIRYKISRLLKPMKINPYSVSELKHFFENNNLKLQKIIQIRFVPLIVLDKIIVLKKG